MTDGVDKTGRQNIERKIQHNMSRGEEKKKATPRLCSCGEHSVGTAKNTSAHKHIITTWKTIWKHMTCNRGGEWGGRAAIQSCSHAGRWSRTCLDKTGGCKASGVSGCSLTRMCPTSSKPQPKEMLTADSKRWLPSSSAMPQKDSGR